jgi:hypothetical protein
VWARLKALEAPSRMTRTLLEESALASFDGRRAVLAIAPNMRSTANMKLVELKDLFRRACGQMIEVVIEGLEAPAASGGGDPAAGMEASPHASAAATSATPAGTATPPSSPESFADHPLIKEAIELFATRPARPPQP